MDFRRRVLAIPIAERGAFLRAARAELAADRLTEPILGTAGPPAHLPPLKTLGAHQHTQPTPLSSLIGRAHETAAIGQLLEQPAVRLVTLLGPPGVGKTRLSIQVAHDLHNDFTDGVFFVPLAPISDPALVAVTI